MSFAIGVGFEPDSLISGCPIPYRQLAGGVIAWYAHAVSHNGVGPQKGEPQGSVNPKTLDAAWYRQFSGATEIARGRREFPQKDFFTALNLMGDWCGPAPTPTD